MAGPDGLFNQWWCQAEVDLRRYVAGLLRRYLDDDDVSEVLQEVAKKAIEKNEPGNSVKTFTHFRYWLNRVALNKIRTIKRRRPGSASNPMRVVDVTEIENTIKVLNNGGEGLDSDLADRLRQAIATLSELERQILYLRVLEEKKFAEIAQLLNRSMDAVRVAYQRLRKKLKRLLGDIWE